MQKILEGLNAEQRQAAEQIKGALLVMAPVGTGKTRVLAHRAANAVENGIDPAKIVCLSFTNKAAREMQERIVSFLGRGAAGITIRTFHALCAHIIRCEADFLGIDADFAIYDEEDVKEILSLILRENRPRGDLQKLAAQLGELFPDIKLKSCLGGLPAGENAFPRPGNLSVPVLKKIFAEYNSCLAANHALDFADLIAGVLRLFRERPEVLSRWQEACAWIQVDEVQDTNLAEYLIISRLAQSHKNLAFFGDIDQTIYEWRGSAPFTIVERFKREFAPVQEVVLVKNYRSTRTILQVCRAFLKQCENAATKEIVSVAAEAGEKVVVHQEKNCQGEGSWIANRIKAIAENRGVPLREIAILTRTNAFGRQLSEVLTAHRIPHFLVEHFKFFRRAEIKDALAYLRFLINRHDAHSLRRILRRPPRGIGEAVLRAIEKIPRAVGLRLVDFVNPLTFRYGDPFGLLLERFAENRVVVLDTETTGLNTAQDEIIELAALKIGAGGITGYFHAYLKNSRPVGESVKIHGLEDEFLAAAGKEPAEVLRSFFDFCAGCVLVGHNLSFDLAMLRSSAARLRLGEFPADHFYDTLEMTRRFFPLKRYTLENICRELGIVQRHPHWALGDAEASAELLNILIPHLAVHREDRKKYVGRYSRQFAPLAGQLEKWRLEMKKKRPGALLEGILEEAGLVEYWRRQPNGPRRLENLAELAGLVRRYDDPALSPPEALVNVLNLAALGNEADRYVQAEDRVLLLTVHQAKGLEFDTIFIAGATDSGFPSWRSQQEGRLDEEHRLFYVALTRAKRRLFITCHLFDEKNKRQRPSRYLEMIPEGLKSYA